MNTPTEKNINKPLAGTPFNALTAAILLGLAAGCGDKPADEAQSPTEDGTAPQAPASSEWKPVVASESATTPSDSQSPESPASQMASSLSAPNNDARATEAELANTAQKGAEALAAKAQSEAEALKSRMEKTLKSDAASLEEQRRLAEMQAKAQAAPAAPNQPQPSPTPDNATTAAATPPPAFRQAPPPELMEIMKTGQALQQEMRGIAAKLQDAHKKALEAPDVAEKQTVLEAAALKAMKEISPDIEPEWLKLKALIKELEANEELASNDPSKISEETKAKFQEMQGLSQKLQPLQLKVADQPAIKQLRDVFAEAVDKQVAKLEPKAEELKTRHAAILEELPKLQQKFMEIQQKYMPAPPTIPAAPATPETTAPTEEKK